VVAAPPGGWRSGRPFPGERELSTLLHSFAAGSMPKTQFYSELNVAIYFISGQYISCCGYLKDLHRK